MMFQEVFGGYIRLDQASNAYKWELYAEKDILFFVIILKKTYCTVIKKEEFFLVKRYYVLKACCAYKQQPDTLLYKAWLKFEAEWNSF